MIYKPEVIGEDNDKAFYEFRHAVENLKQVVWEEYPFFKFVRWLYDRLEDALR